MPLPSPPPQRPFFQHGGSWVLAQMSLILLTLISGPFHHSPSSRIQRALALSLLILGGILAITSALTLGRNLTPLPKPHENNQLITHGPYALVRHPIYTSLILLSTGWTLFWSSPLALLSTILLTLVLNTKASREEAWLTQKHPHYRTYQKKVRKLIPWI